MRRVLLLSIAAALFSLAAHAQVFNIDFNEYPEFVFAENLGIPGVSFVASPTQSWVTVDSNELAFVSLGGTSLYQPSQVGTLEIMFSTSMANVSFSFAQNDFTSTAQLRAEAYNGPTLVGSVTQTAIPPTEFNFGEGFIDQSRDPAPLEEVPARHRAA